MKVLHQVRSILFDALIGKVTCLNTVLSLLRNEAADPACWNFRTWFRLAKRELNYVSTSTVPSSVLLVTGKSKRDHI